MRKLIVFNQVSLDGFFSDLRGDMSWAHKQDPEWEAFTAENASGGGELLFGRITYELMASFWPTPAAKASAPDLARHMNALPKVVFSRTLTEASWENTRLRKGTLTDEARSLKAEAGPTLVLMGSGTIVSQLADAGLIDEYQLVVNPIALGKGKTLFDGIERRLSLKLTTTRAFTNGNVVSCYVPIA